MGDIFHHVSFLANHGQEYGGRGDLDIEAWPNGLLTFGGVLAYPVIAI